MGKKKSVDESPEMEKIIVSFYSDEFDKVKEVLEISEVTSRAIRESMELAPTHRQRTGTELREEIAELSNEERKELLEEIRKKKEKQ